MIKLIYCFRKRWGLTDTEFSHYWETVHGPLSAEIPGLRRMVQSHAIGEQNHNFEYDGMAELWFDDLATLDAARSTPEWARCKADESNFVDPFATFFFIVHEREILPPQD